MKRVLLVSLISMGILTGIACDKNRRWSSPVTPTPMPLIYATATASANVYVRCENGTTVTVTATGYGEAYAANYDEAKKMANHKAQADLEIAKAKAQANVTVVCGTAMHTPPPAPSPSPQPAPPSVAPPPIPVPLPPLLLPCAYAISTVPDFAYTGGNGSVSIGTSRPDCQWTGRSDAYWIEIKSGSYSNGTGTVFFTVAMSNGSRREGTITITGTDLPPRIVRIVERAQ